MAQSRHLRIGTRASPLALWQAGETRARLAAAHALEPEAIEIVPLRTSGDRMQAGPLRDAGGKGLFTKEIDEALLDGRVDIAVHSAKDVPTWLPDGIAVLAYLPREDVRDAFLSPHAGAVEELPAGALIGTASLRRQALVLRLRPDLRVAPFRGNVDTRLAKLARGEAQATLLAAAGLKRLGMLERASGLLDPHAFPPALGQGAIALAARADDARAGTLLEALDDRPTHVALLAERALLTALDGSCRTPIAGLAQAEGGRVRLRGLIVRPDGSEAHETSREAGEAEAEAAGRDAGLELKARGGPDFFAEM